jgi:hypothetical protein
MTGEDAARVTSAIALEAKQEAVSLTRNIQTKITELTEESKALQESISVEEEKLFCLQNANTKRAKITQDEFQQKDAARKRAAYWTAKQKSAQSAANRSPPTDSCSLISNRSNSSIVKAITSAVEHILRTLGQFNEVAKKEFFKKFLLHHSVRRL